MMKNFGGVNEALKRAEISPAAELMQQLIQAAQAQRGNVEAIAEQYARTYVMVQELSVNGEGKVEDQTDSGRVSVADNTLAAAQTRIKQQRAATEQLAAAVTRAISAGDQSMKVRYKIPQANATWGHTYSSSTTNTFNVSSAIVSPMLQGTYFKAVRTFDDTTKPSDEKQLPRIYFFRGLSMTGKVSITIGSITTYGYLRAACATGRMGTSNWLPESGAHFVCDVFMRAKSTDNTAAPRANGSAIRIPGDAISGKVAALFRPQLGVVSNGNGSVGIGWYLTRADGVTDEQIAEVDGASAFEESKCNKIFCGAYYSINSSGDVSVAISSWKAMNPPFSAITSSVIVKITDTPYGYERDEKANSFVQVSQEIVKLGVARQLFGNFFPDTTSTTQIENLQSVLVWMRCMPVLKLPMGDETPDAVITRDDNPWLCYLLSDNQDTVETKTGFEMQDSSGNYWENRASKGFLATSYDTIDYSSVNSVPMIVSRGHATSASETDVEVVPNFDVGSVVAQSMVYSNQDDIERIILAL